MIELLFKLTTIGYSHSSLLEYKNNNKQKTINKHQYNNKVTQGNKHKQIQTKHKQTQKTQTLVKITKM